MGVMIREESEKCEAEFLGWNDCWKGRVLELRLDLKSLLVASYIN